MKRFKEGIDSMGYNTGGSVTAIVPIIVGNEKDTLELCKMVNDEGVFICPILFPAIPKGTNRLRAHVLTTHTSEDIDEALDIFERSGKKLGLI
jgi:glycine C-acetyltransferase